ncbi:MAG: hypothetical protein ACFFCZ_07465 [Promethearchaeota archaeon]
MCPQKNEKEFDEIITSLEKRIKNFSKNVKDDKDTKSDDNKLKEVKGETITPILETGETEETEVIKSPVKSQISQTLKEAVRVKTPSKVQSSPPEPDDSLQGSKLFEKVSSLVTSKVKNLQIELVQELSTSFNLTLEDKIKRFEKELKDRLQNFELFFQKTLGTIETKIIDLESNNGDKNPCEALLDELALLKQENNVLRNQVAKIGSMLEQMVESDASGPPPESETFSPPEPVLSKEFLDSQSYNVLKGLFVRNLLGDDTIALQLLKKDPMYPVLEFLQKRSVITEEELEAFCLQYDISPEIIEHLIKEKIITKVKSYYVESSLLSAELVTTQDGSAARLVDVALSLIVQTDSKSEWKEILLLLQTALQKKLYHSEILFEIFSFTSKPLENKEKVVQKLYDWKNRIHPSAKPKPKLKSEPQPKYKSKTSPKTDSKPSSEPKSKPKPKSKSGSKSKSKPKDKSDSLSDDESAPSKDLIEA